MAKKKSIFCRFGIHPIPPTLNSDNHKLFLLRYYLHLNAAKIQVITIDINQPKGKPKTTHTGKGIHAHTHIQRYTININPPLHLSSDKGHLFLSHCQHPFFCVSGISTSSMFKSHGWRNQNLFSLVLYLYFSPLE